jgi:uncharacterized protein DUF6496
MPWDEVMSKFKSGALKSGSSGATVRNPKQAIAIMESEKRKGESGKTEYQSGGVLSQAARRKKDG